WHRIFEQLQAQADADGLITWDVSVDSTIARADRTRRVPKKGGSAGRAAGRCRRTPVTAPPSTEISAPA
ncbi:hypothetical protein ACWD5R_44835, partial [Streptomyces sp. NPDC002514]